MNAEHMKNGYTRRFRMVVYRIDNTEYSVLSLNSTFGKPKQYVVKWIGYKWICSCPDYAKHSELMEYACKHIQAMFKATVNKRARDGVEVEIERRYRVNRNGRNGRKAVSEAVDKKDPAEVMA